MKTRWIVCLAVLMLMVVSVQAEEIDDDAELTLGDAQTVCVRGQLFAPVLLTDDGDTADEDAE